MSQLKIRTDNFPAHTEEQLAEWVKSIKTGKELTEGNPFRGLRFDEILKVSEIVVDGRCVKNQIWK